jgi:hypothetical protein
VHHGHDHFVSCVFVPSGVLVACALNAPGSWHDSEIAAICKLYDKLQSVYDRTGGVAVVDAAFSKKHCPFMIKSGKAIYNLPPSYASDSGMGNEGNSGYRPPSERSIVVFGVDRESKGVFSPHNHATELSNATHWFKPIKIYLLPKI